MMNQADPVVLLLPQHREDLARWHETKVRLRMLTGHWEEDITRRLCEKLTPGRIVNLGRPTQSLNLFASVVRQLACQYDSEPTITNTTLSAAQATAWTDLTTAAHLWPILQRNSESVIGLRESILQVHWTENGLRLVSITPDTVTVETTPGDPSDIRVIRAARSYLIDGDQVPAWAVWTIMDPGAPRFYVEDAEGRDITSKAVTNPDEPWAYFGPDGKPFLPFVQYRAQHTCEAWDPYTLSELVHAGLDCAILWTAWNKILLDASWAQRWIIDLMLQGLTIQNMGNAGTTGSVETDPTSILVFKSGSDKNGSVGQWQVPTDPKAAAEAILTFQGSVLSNIGIHPADLESTTGPSSGVAISLKRSAQRRLAARYIPQFRSADTELLSKMAMVQNIFGEGVALPTEGWSLSYRLPEETVEEFIAELDRDQRLVEGGFMSKVDQMMKYHPEMDRPAAIARLRQVAEENRLFPVAA